MNIEEKIAVMKAHAEGKTIEARQGRVFTTTVCTRDWSECPTPVWDWLNVEYRIAPEPKKEGRWERVEIVKQGNAYFLTGDDSYRIDALPSYRIDVLSSIPGFGGIDYQSPFDEKRIVQSMVPVMFDPFGGAMTAGFSGINTSCRPGIPVAAWFWRE